MRPLHEVCKKDIKMLLGISKQALTGKSKSTYGYKTQINVDEEGLIKAIAYSAGNVHDSNHFTALLKGNESAAYADSVFQSQTHTDWTLWEKPVILV